MRTTSFIKIASLSLLGLFASCEEKEDDVVNCDISFENVVSQDDDDSKTTIVFEATTLESTSDVKYFWSINGTDSNELSARLEYTFIENGTYEVCVFTETPECPQGVEFCKEVTIDNLNETTDGCPNISFTKNLVSNDGLTYKFSATGATESIYDWFINDEFTQTGLEGDDNQYLTYKFTENGTYTICVGVETPDCPNGVKYCKEVIIDTIKDTTETCPEITISREYVTTGNTSADLIIANGKVGSSNYDWYIDGELISQDYSSGDNNEVLNYPFDQGTYEVCAAVETPECPNGITECIQVANNSIRPVFNITVDNPHATGDCLDLTYDYSISQNNPNKYILEANQINNTSAGGILTDGYYSWSIRKSNENNDEYIGSGRIFEHEFTEVGDYVICVFVETPDCPMGVKFCKNFNVDYLMIN